MQIEKLVELLKFHLQSKKLSDFKTELSDLDIESIDKLVKFNKDHYCKNLIIRNKEFEIYIIGWEPGQETKYHKHPENGCLMKIISGSLIEDIKTNTNIISNNRTVGECSYIHDNIGIHKVKNNKDTKSITLHIYSPPTFYD